jgi:uncharacterized protein (DUF305 family)
MTIHKALAVAAMALALLVAGCGSDESDSGDNASSGSSSSATTGNGIDRAFAQAMVPHHESAVEMAGIAKQRGETQFVRDLANDIVRTQTDEIETLRTQDAELERSGVETGDLGLEHSAMGMEDDPSMLEDSEPFDTAFIDMMIPHHEGALAMAKVELEKGADPELKALAQQIIDAQQREITAMREHLGATDDGHEMEDEHHSG